MVKHNLKKGSGACCPTLPHFLVSSTKRFERAGVELCIYQSTGRSSGLPPLPWQAEPRDPSPFTTSQTVNLSLSFPICPFHPCTLLLSLFTCHFRRASFTTLLGGQGPKGSYKHHGDGGCLGIFVRSQHIGSNWVLCLNFSHSQAASKSPHQRDKCNRAVLTRPLPSVCLVFCWREQDQATQKRNAKNPPHFLFLKDTWVCFLFLYSIAQMEASF